MSAITDLNNFNPEEDAANFEEIEQQFGKFVLAAIQTNFQLSRRSSTSRLTRSSSRTSTRGLSSSPSELA